MSRLLEGRVALITGAARGIGKGIALVLAAEGADIVVNDRLLGADGAEVVAAVRALGQRAFPIEADVAEEADVRRMFAAIDAEFGRLDILVNNAGISKPQTIDETSLAEWQHVMNVNLTSCFLCSKAALERMKAQRWGRIVNISSMAGQQGALYGHVHYSASKSAILGFTKTLARTAAPHGITVNAVAPGITETELLLKTHGPEQIDELIAKIPVGGWSKPRHVGLTVAFLCGEAGEVITGATIDMNGGIYMR
jgi:NAD(P)-dependent dehydrogenase (short-subunit alcohol dehydrogenase family)